MTMPIALVRFAAFAVLALVIVAQPAAATGASPNDVARILAGLPVAESSPLAKLTESGGWKAHAKSFGAAWEKLDTRQLAKIRQWQEKTLPAAQPTLFYMFSGPDFLYADAFFPKAQTYVLSGLEPIGAVPDLSELSSGALTRELRQLQTSMNSVMSYSFFITEKMKKQLKAGQVNGTLPVLYVFLARSGKTIEEVSFVELDLDGMEHPAGSIDAKSATKGVRIVFSGGAGAKQTLYYFTTDLSNSGVRKSGFLKFCDVLGTGDAFVKSASYLMHSGNFSTVRDFLLSHGMTVLQDDSGIPVQHFAAADWDLRPFGSYRGPISLFSGRYQPKLATLFKNAARQSIDFGLGYRWRPHESNVLLAVKKPIAAQAGPAR